MPLGGYPGMDDHNHANRICTISPSIPPVDYRIPVQPATPNKRKMLPPRTPPTQGKEQEMDESNVGGLLMDLAEEGSEDGTSTPAENMGSAIPPTGDKAHETPGTSIGA